MLAHTVENGTEAQPGTGTKVNPGHSWTVILMSVRSRALKGVISEYVTGSQGIPGPSCLSSMCTGLKVPVLSLLPVQGPVTGLWSWNGRGFSSSFLPCHMLEPLYSRMASKNWVRPRWADMSDVRHPALRRWHLPQFSFLSVCSWVLWALGLTSARWELDLT